MVIAGNTKVVIVRDIESARLPSTLLRRTLVSILQDAKESGTVHVIVTGDVTMRRLNRRFRGKDKTTDVLSFPFDDALPGTETVEMIGEIYCNYAHCKRWIRDNGGTINDELLRLAVHGCLHLLGYDHHDARDQKRMVRAENKYLESGGLIRQRNWLSTTA